ncbi:MAG: conjugal transfer protein TraF [Bacilli bacterium]|nr:conjugal transfer protein TraF [Bacilli bacterium]
MEKNQKILLGIIAFIFAVVIGIGVYLFIERDDKSLSDAAKFKKEYESLNGKTYEGTDIEYLEVKVDKDNLFKYASEEEALKLLKNDTALIYFGFAPCPYCRSMINILNDVAKENEIKNIYYVDILNSRDTYEVINGQAVKISSGTENYYKILDILKKYLTDYEISDKDGKSYPTGVKRLYAPTVVAVKDGQIVGFHEVTVDTAVKGKHLTKEEASQLKDIYQTMIDEMNSDMCTSKGC